MKKFNKVLFAATLNPLYEFKNWYEPLKKISKEVLVFDVPWTFIRYGKDKMNQMFLDYVKKEKPDFIFFWYGSKMLTIETLFKIRDISPNSKTFRILSDSDSQFETFLRYLMLFVDFGFENMGKKYIRYYKKDGIKNIFSSFGAIDTKFLHPLKLKKTYDVAFIGQVGGERMWKREEYIKFLKDNGVNIKVFGLGYDKFPEFKDIYSGFLTEEEKMKVLNQSKITICFSKNPYGIPGFKDKFFESGACKSFTLTEYYGDYLEYFTEGKDIVTFKTKEELLQKINYYLKNEKEREKIANEFYNRIKKEFNVYSVHKRAFEKIEKINFKHQDLPRINKKIAIISENEIFLDERNLKELLKDKDYIILKKGYCENLKFRKMLQAYSLKKTKKPISCCDYFVNNKILGDYLEFYSARAIKMISKEDFYNFLDINQLMVTKDFLFKNLKKIRGVYEGVGLDFINEDNTAFVSFGLIRIKKNINGDYKVMKHVFYFYYLYDLFSLKFQKRLFFSFYPYALVFYIIFGKKFIFDSIKDALNDKKKQNAIKEYEKFN